MLSLSINSLKPWTVFVEPFSHGTGTLRCLQKEMATYRHWSVLVARPRRCPTLSNPVPWQNCMAAYLGYTLRMKTLFRGWRWPVMVHDTHTRRIPGNIEVNFKTRFNVYSVTVILYLFFYILTCFPTVIFSSTSTGQFRFMFSCPDSFYCCWGNNRVGSAYGRQNARQPGDSSSNGLHGENRTILRLLVLTQYRRVTVTAITAIVRSGLCCGV